MKARDDTIFDEYISSDETLLWVGRPNPLRLLSLNDIFQIPLTLVWGGFMILWEMQALRRGAPNEAILSGLLFVAIGQYVIWGRFIHKYLVRRNTYYALTNRRALSLSRFGITKFKPYSFHQITSLQRRGKAVLFNVPSPPSQSGPRRHPSWLYEPQSGEGRPGFYALEDADSVYSMVQDLIMPKANS